VTPPAKLGIGLVFTACAGFIDAVGLLELGGYFVSFMSGNTTQLGVGLGGLGLGIALPFSLVVMFFAGSLAGSLLALSSRRWGPAAALGLVLAVLLVSTALAALVGIRQAMLALAIAGGAQNAVLPPRGAARLGATFVSGTLFAAGQDLARALRGLAPRWRWLQHLLVWASLCGGAAVGAVVEAHWGVPALLAPAAVYLAFLVDFLVRGPVDVA
jgi:uncharacterized membrane protein YoaK (UPF0700 family)